MLVNSSIKQGLLILTSSTLIACGGGGGGTPNTGPGSGGSTNRAPVANAGDDIQGIAGKVVTLSGANSSDADGNTLSFAWAQTSGSPLELLASDGSVTSDMTQSTLNVFIPTSASGETFEFSLTVNDGTLSSSADTVSISAASCEDADGEVFVDCADPTWGVLGGWDDQLTAIYTENNVNHVQWDVVYGGSLSRQSVIDVRYTDPITWGTFYLIKPGFVAEDMTAYIGGRILFDIKLISAGNASPQVSFSINCAEGRCNGELLPLSNYNFDASTLNTWQQIEIPVADIIASGVDLSDTGNGFHITSEFGVSQEGLNFQVDNIHWDNSECYDGEGDVFVDCADPTWGELGGWDNEINDLYTDNTSNHVRWSVETNGVLGKLIDVSFNDAKTLGTFYIKKPSFEPEDMSDYAAGSVEFDIKLIDSGVASPAITFSINCAEGRCHGGLLNLVDYGFSNVDNSWQSIVIPVADIVNSGVDISDVGTGFHISSEWGVSQQDLNFQLAKIRWKK